MMGFTVGTAAVILAAWIVRVATYRSAYLHGMMDANQQWRHAVTEAHSDDPRIRYIAARFSAGCVPAGTFTPTHTGYCYPQDCDSDCPQSITRNPEAQAAERRRLARVRRTIRDDPGHTMMCDCDRCLRAFGG